MMINYRNIKLSHIGTVLFCLLLLIGAVKTVNAIIEHDQRITAIREANDGVIPGKEAIDQQGNRYNVRIMTYNDKEYVCFVAAQGMACVNAN